MQILIDKNLLIDELPCCAGSSFSTVKCETATASGAPGSGGCGSYLLNVTFSFVQEILNANNIATY